MALLMSIYSHNNNYKRRELAMVALTTMVDYSVEQGVAVLTLNNPPVNALSQGVRQGLKEGVEKALADDSASAILIYCWY